LLCRRWRVFFSKQTEITENAIHCQSLTCLQLLLLTLTSSNKSSLVPQCHHQNSKYSAPLHDLIHCKFSIKWWRRRLLNGSVHYRLIHSAHHRLMWFTSSPLEEPQMQVWHVFGDHLVWPIFVRFSSIIKNFVFFVHVANFCDLVRFSFKTNLLSTLINFVNLRGGSAVGPFWPSLP